MDIGKLLRAYVERVVEEVEARKAKETDALIIEIVAFHYENALNKSLDERNQVSFKKIVEMEETKCLLN